MYCYILYRAICSKSRFFCYNTNSGRALAVTAGAATERPVREADIKNYIRPFLVQAAFSPARRRDTPARNGGGLMAKNEKDRSLYEWTVLIVKLLGALSSLLAVLVEIFR